ncbi:hypothetical protein SAMN04487904_10399 [Actinopolyspora lacussalsi subsp. righensis]|uniref:Uncharacterized protein n=1 Tax=Actinopolyspora righensis TaxID=995060 RepID=A0A1I6YQJ4_9ACTN|nr:hypothetical protein SAMN04487904_10399 [Actinopolyspora righensis]
MTAGGSTRGTATRLDHHDALTLDGSDHREPVTATTPDSGPRETSGAGPESDPSRGGGQVAYRRWMCPAALLWTGLTHRNVPTRSKVRSREPNELAPRL